MLIRYGCILIPDKFGTREYQIRLLGFKNIKDLLFIKACCCFKYPSSLEYPHHIDDFDRDSENVKMNCIDGFPRFKMRLSNKHNKLFETLDECAIFCKELKKDEKEYGRHLSIERLICDSGIDEEYYKECLDIIDKESFVIFMNTDFGPVYSRYKIEDVFRTLDGKLV